MGKKSKSLLFAAGLLLGFTFFSRVETRADEKETYDVKKEKISKIEMNIKSSAIEIKEGKDDFLITKYDKKNYKVILKKDRNKLKLHIKSKTGDNDAAPVIIYMPNKKLQEVNMKVIESSVECDKIFASNEVFAEIDSSNVDLGFPVKSSLSFKGKAKDSNLIFSSDEDFKNYNVHITCFGGEVEIPDYFTKRKNTYSYGKNKKGSIMLTVDGKGMTEIE